jgi:NADH-quinone oxidoreductase subunit J
MSPILFYVIAALLIFFALRVIISPNPIHSALNLVLTMLGLAGLFFHLNAQFIAGVQVIVYAGAVMVLFVMVLMLFDLQQELRAFAKGFISGLLKIAAVAAIFGGVVGALKETGTPEAAAATATLANQATITKDLSLMLYSKYLLAFEVLGVLLLVVAVGVVAVSRVRGGTHAKH